MKATLAGFLPHNATLGTAFGPVRASILEATALAMASVSLVACDGPWEIGFGTPPFVRNASDLDETVSVRTYHFAFACDAVHSGSPAISRAGLDEPRIVTLSSGETVELLPTRQPDAARASSDSCGAAVVASARLRSPLLITWDLHAGVDADSSVQNVDKEHVYLEQFGAELRPSPGPGMVVTQWNEQDAPP
jgi:hypothetical protein